MSHVDSPSARQLLSGPGRPRAGSGLEPLNGTNDPWRWWVPVGGAANGFWASDPVSVSWGAGATVASFAAPDAGSLFLVIAQGDNPYDLLNATSAFGGMGTFVGGTTYAGAIRNPSDPATATSAGSGVAFLGWGFASEAALTGSPYTGTNADVLPTETRTVADILGADFTISASYTWPEEPIGNEGDYYIDEDTLDSTVDLYGPRRFGTWGNTPIGHLGGVLKSPDGSPYRIVVANDGTLSTVPA